ncbi:hypothetical protein GCM10011374_23390 [Kocuria dechangensis]|uniref:Uncharacterized protein n=1 Tax=Kocuria dechangensis TaxID=1176249 RepID=A0A917GWX2_9MICC|nr:hypothetical protein [Kocuria dechangensis]GGG59875.1 hypothetical protein GCM10011374_23390 [Kocuria dechangensis]
MTEPLYEHMASAQAADTLDEFLTARSPALQQLRSMMTARGLSPDVLLEATVESVAPVWEWISTRAAELGVDPRSLEEDPTRSTWPSWARHGMLVDPHPPAETLALVDGFTSYLAQIITAAVPDVQWLVGEHRLDDYPMRNYPVLAAGGHQIFLPAIPLYSAYQSAHGRDPMSGTEMLHHTRRTISALRGQGPVAEGAEEPLVTVVAEVDCFDVGLRADLPEQHPQVVERLITELTDRDGVVSVHRYGPAALVVDAPHWDETRLKLWLTLWLQRHLHIDR